MDFTDCNFKHPNNLDQDVYDKKGKSMKRSYLGVRWKKVYYEDENGVCGSMYVVEATDYIDFVKQDAGVGQEVFFTEGDKLFSFHVVAMCGVVIPSAYLVAQEFSEAVVLGREKKRLTEFSEELAEVDVTDGCVITPEAVLCWFWNKKYSDDSTVLDAFIDAGVSVYDHDTINFFLAVLRCDVAEVNYLELSEYAFTCFTRSDSSDVYMETVVGPRYKEFFRKPTPVYVLNRWIYTDPRLGFHVTEANVLKRDHHLEGTRIELPGTYHRVVWIPNVVDEIPRYILQGALEEYEGCETYMYAHHFGQYGTHYHYIKSGTIDILRDTGVEQCHNLVFYGIEVYSGVLRRLLKTLRRGSACDEMRIKVWETDLAIDIMRLITSRKFGTEPGPMDKDVNFLIWLCRSIVHTKVEPQSTMLKTNQLYHKEISSLFKYMAPFANRHWGSFVKSKSKMVPIIDFTTISDYRTLPLGRRPGNGGFLKELRRARILRDKAIQAQPKVTVTLHDSSAEESS